MSKVTRATQSIFGSTAGSNQMAEFGSLAAGSPALYSGSTISPAIIQTLSNFLSGWYSAVLGANSPAIQDMNALFYLVTYQLAYLLQQGIPEYDAGTTYYQNSFVTYNGVVYYSIQNSNTGNTPSSSPSWWFYFPGNAALNPQANTTLAAIAVGSWVAESASAANLWTAICWSPELSLFVAVGTSGVYSMYSSTGKSWTSGSSVQTGNWTSVAWSPKLGLFAAVGTSAIMYSSDGSNWTSASSPSDELWEGVCWSPENSQFVAVATPSAGTNQVMVSNNGTSWTGETISQANNWRSVCWSAELGIYVTVANNGTNRVATSTNGISWTLRSAASANTWQSVCWSSTLRIFCAVSFDGHIMTSPDGITWTSQTPAASGYDFQNIAWSPQLGAFVAVAQSGTDAFQYSLDGVNWFLPIVAAPATNAWTGIAWSPQLGIFAAVSSNGTNRVAISTYVKKFIS